jgi:uncharacterized protein (DUF1501 family)
MLGLSTRRGGALTGFSCLLGPIAFLTSGANTSQRDNRLRKSMVRLVLGGGLDDLPRVSANGTFSAQHRQIPL